MKKSNGLMTTRHKIIPNERRRQTWRKHRLNLIDRRSKWFYQQQDAENEAKQTAEDADTDAPQVTTSNKTD